MEGGFHGECGLSNMIGHVTYYRLFQVKESPVASDSLLTLDLKSGSKVNIGTYAITLDKVFDGQLKATRVFDIGNGKG